MEFRKNASVKKNQKGFTLVELGIVVGLVLLLLSGLAGASRVISGTKVNDEVSELRSIVSNVQKIYAGASVYTGATLTDIIALKGLPDARVTSATTAANRFGGALTFTVSTLSSTDDSLKMSSAATPEYECLNIIPQVDSVFSKIMIGTNIVKPVGGTVSKTVLATGCTGGNKTIDYYFGK